MKAISSKMVLILSVSAVVIIAIGIIAYYFYIAKPAGEVKEVNIAVFMPLSGEQSVYGHDILQAIQYAAEEINSQGGIRCLGGAKINLIVVDITSDAAKRFL